MVTADAIRFGDRDRLLGFSHAEHPVALGNWAAANRTLWARRRIGTDYGYDEINLNVGCPSDRVQSGRFGACPMREPDLVADCVAAMQVSKAVPVTVKCRIGVDDQELEEALFTLVDLCAKAGVRHFIVHARKAWLRGLSPKENRDIPPLDYGLVARLKQARPELSIILNGGIESLAEAQAHLAQFDGVMLGGAAYKNPYMLAAIDQALFGDTQAPPSREEIIDRLIPYVETVLAEGTPLHGVTRHIWGCIRAVRAGGTGGGI